MYNYKNIPMKIIKKEVKNGKLSASVGCGCIK
jgi:hypothetical protein